METAARAPRISELIDGRELSSFQMQTMLLCGLVLVLDGFATQSIGFLAPSMAQSLKIPISSFGPIFAAALFGLMVSSLLAGPVADRLGRKGPILFATLTFGTFTLATTLATTLHGLVAIRFLAGLGLGSAIPNVVALATEYAPKRLQRVVVTMLFCGMPMGALIGGGISSLLLPRYGWRAVFYAGGALPLAVTLLLLVWLPESLRFLGLERATGGDGRRHAQVQAIVSEIAPEVRDFSPEPPGTQEDRPGFPVKDLFTGGRAAGTLLLWIPFFMNLLMLYFIVNWLPALLRQTHMPVAAGVLAISLFSLGGVVGSAAQGYAMRTLGGRTVILSEFVLSLGLISLLGFVSSYAAIMTLVLFCGILVQGAQAGLNALSATYYPTSMRSTGVGWALGVGRLGSILGPMLGGLMLAHAWTLRQIFFAGALPALLAALAIAAGSVLLRPENSPYRAV